MKTHTFTKLILSLLAFFAAAFAPATSSAQTTLSAGDVAVIGYNTSGTPDTFALLFLKDLAAGTTFYVNDNEVAADGGTNFTDTNEVEATFTVSSGQTVAAGSVVILPWGSTPVTDPRFTWTGHTSGGLGNNDELYIYTGTSPTAAPTAFIFYAKIGTSVSARPNGLTAGSTFISPTGAASRYKTVGATYSGTASALLSAIGNTAANWEAVIPGAAGDWTFTVTSATITGAATATAFTTTYGTASTAQSFSVSGSNLTANITATAPTGFEVSSDGTTYGATATITQSGGSASGTISIRLKATAVVGGSYNAQNIALTSTGATTVNIATAASGNTVNAAALTITGMSGVSRDYNGTTTATLSGTPAYVGLQNGESFSVTGTASANFDTAAVGTAKPITVTGYTAPSGNYTVSQPTGLTADVNAVALMITATDVTKPFGNTLTGGVGYVGFTSMGLVNSETIGSVTVAYGSGAAALDPVGNYPGSVTLSAATGGTFTPTNYSISYVPGDINVSASPTIATSGTLTAVNTIYGTASPSPTSFTVSGGNLMGDITVTPPAGFEVSTTIGSGYTTSLALTPTSQTVAATTVYVRLRATATVSGSPYSGNVMCLSSGATSQNVATAASAVAAKGLTITGVSGVSREYDATDVATLSGTPAYVGLENGESFSVTGTASATFNNKTVGTAKPITVIGYTAPSANYTVSQPTGLTADVNAKALTVSGAAVTTKQYDGNMNATIIGMLVGVINPDVVTLNGTGTFASAGPGTGIAVTSTSTLGGADGGNYSLTQPSGLTGDITANTNNNLSALTLSTGALNPGFASGTLNYTAHVLLSTSSITVTPTTASAAATVTVNGNPVTSGTASSAIALNAGSGNLITVVVTAQDTTTKTYTIDVTRSDTFSSGNLVVLRVSAGAPLSNIATAVSLAEYSTVAAQSAPLQTVAIDSTATGLTLTGNSTTQGTLTRSVDGSLLTFGGYRKAAGGTNPQSDQTATTKRVIGVIGASVASTNLATAVTDGYSQDSFRGVATVSGTSYYLSGAGSSATGGVRYVSTIGGDTTSVPLNPGSGNSNTRQVAILGGNLFVSSGATVPGTGVFKVGSTLPTSGNQTYTSSITTTAQIQSYYFTNLGSANNWASTGFDTVYTSDGTTLAKWSYNGTAWVSNGSVAIAGLGNIIGETVGTTVTIYGTTTTEATGTVFRLTDSSGSNATITGSTTTLATAGTNTAFRGIAFAPAATAPDLTVSVSAPATAPVSTNFNYTLVAANPGTANATGVAVNFTLPAGLTFVSASGTGFTANNNAGVINFTGGSLNAGASATLTVTVNTATAATYTALAGAAVIDPSNTIAESNETNNSSTAAATTSVTATVSIAAASVTEGNSGTVTLSLPVTRSDTSTAFTLNYAVTGGTATAGTDFVTVAPGTLTFTAGGGAMQTIDITVNGDTDIEPNETITVTLSGLVNTTGLTTITTATANGTITNDDVVPLTFLPSSQLTATFKGFIGLGGAEIPSFDPASKRAFVSSGVGVQVVDLTNPAAPAFISTIAPNSLGVSGLTSNDVSSVAVRKASGGNPAIVAAAIINNPKTTNGHVVILNAATGALIGSVVVGANPDNVVFSPDGTKLLVANEGELNGTTTTDTSGNSASFPDPALGSVSILSISPAGVPTVTATANFTAFDSQVATLRAAGVRIFGNNPPSSDLEPEYIAIAPDGMTAMVTLQENNALAKLDIATATFTNIYPLGKKDFSTLRCDFSDQDAVKNPKTGQPVFGLYMPDGIASYEVGGQTYYVTANEGDDRNDFLSPAETTTVGNAGYSLDATVFPTASTLKQSANLGRLTVSNFPGLRGDTDGDGDIDEILSYGGRSISIHDANGNRIWDSGDMLEMIVASQFSANFDDNRSDNKGPEPEGVTIATFGTRTYAFISLERSHMVVLFDITNPLAPTYTGGFTRSGDLNPEGMAVVQPSDSPTGKALLLVSSEVSNTLTVFELTNTLTVPATKVAAGDVTPTSAVLLAHVYGTGLVSIDYSTDATFATGVTSTNVVVTDPALPVKVTATGLTAGTTYFYRCGSATGTFKTAPASSATPGLHFGISGDSRGDIAPFPSMKNAAGKNLDFFLYFGDTVYADVSSPDVPIAQARSLAEFRAKHNEVYSPRYGMNSLGDLRASTAIFAVIDDHEVTNDFDGGALRTSDARFSSDTGTYINETQTFLNGLQAFTEYNPISYVSTGATGDPITANKQSLYRYSVQGKTAAMFVLDTRSFRSPALTPVADITNTTQVTNFLIASFTPGRTLLGSAQKAQFKADLLAAQSAGVIWKFVCCPEPIQNFGPLGAQDRYEGYAAERTELLKFIGDNNITNVVFVTADFHGTVVNKLSYQMGPGQPQIQTSNIEIITGAIAYDKPFGPTIVDLAMAAGLAPTGTDVTYQSLPAAQKEGLVFNNIINPNLASLGYNQVSLTTNPLPNMTLLGGLYTATNSYGWTEFTIDQATLHLNVKTWGIDPYSKTQLDADPSGITGRTPVVVSEFKMEPGGYTTFAAWLAANGYTGTAGGDTDGDGIPDALEYFFNTNPNNGGGRGNLPTVVMNGNDLEFRFTYLNSTVLAGYLKCSEDLVDWVNATAGVDYDVITETVNGVETAVRYRIFCNPLPTTQGPFSYTTPFTAAVGRGAIDQLTITNHGMVGAGRLTGEQLDSFGETMGSSSGLAISGWSYDSGVGQFSGTFNVLPDRGYNSGSTYSNYAARIHQVTFTFTPYYGAGPVAQTQILPTYGSTTKFTYLDGTTTKFTSGLNPTGVSTMFGQSVGTVTAANGPGGAQETLLSFDAEAVHLFADGSGFVSDEYGTYIARFNSAKQFTRIIQLPEAARPRVSGNLNFDSVNAPGSGRRNNQGLEGLSVSPDETRLFALLQSATVQDTNGTNQQTRYNTRLFVYDIAGAKRENPVLIGEHVVQLPRWNTPGTGGAVNRTAAQSEIVALSNTQFLMLPRDGLGLGSGSTTTPVTKTVDLVDFSSASNILGVYDGATDQISPSGTLRTTITPARSTVVVNLLSSADLTKFGFNTNTASPNQFTVNEKIEGMALVPDTSTASTEDYYLFVANDNDFQSSNVRMIDAAGNLVSHGDARDRGITNDAVFTAWRITICPNNRKFFRIDVNTNP